eukprot:3371683-Pleurochrysis_carterae.AAC.1
MQEDGRRHMAAVSWVLKKVLGARVPRGSQQRDSALDEQICLSQFTLMLCRNVREAGDVLSVSNGRRTSIGYVGREEA